jgi:hypothetical protein
MLTGSSLGRYTQLVHLDMPDVELSPNPGSSHHTLTATTASSTAKTTGWRERRLRQEPRQIQGLWRRKQILTGRTFVSILPLLRL